MAVGLGFCASGSSRVGPVDVPVAQDLGAPALDLGPVGDGKPRDRALPTFVIAVEDVDHHPGPRIGGTAQLLVLRVRSLANRPLPETAVAGGYVEVARVAPEVLRIRTRRIRGPLGHLHAPAVYDGQAGAAVAQRDRQVHPLVLHVHGSAVAWNREDHALAKADPLRRILLA